jgi:hypothetical protein
MSKELHDHSVLGYASAAGDSRRQSAPGVVSCVVFGLLCLWFAWGVLHGIDVFYSAAGGPAASARWDHIVAGVGTAGAVGGLVIGLAAARARGRARLAATCGFACNGAAFLLYGFWLISLL